jgi:MoaA/NifB/PqqE/SkfB family radical SAM enzyme
MRIKNKSKVVSSLLAVKLFGRRVPLAVRWQLTNRCVLKCRYCNVWRTESREMDLGQIMRVLDRLAELGTQTISFSGGEPMLRKDIFEILRRTKSKGISTEMNSTGAFIPENVHRLKDLDFLKISLDGPEQVNDCVRGAGAFRMAIAAAEAASRNNLRFIFTATLTRHNISHLDFIVETAVKYGTMVAFQPVKSLYRGLNDISGLIPDVQEYRNAVSRLMLFKKRSAACLRNSMIGLRHIYGWPVYLPLKCWAGNLFAIIETDGTVYPCDRIAYDRQLPNCSDRDIGECIGLLPRIKCAGCGFCGVMELNFLMALRPGILDTFSRILK